MEEHSSASRYWMPIVYLCCMLVDGQLTAFLRNLTQGQLFMNAHLLILLLMVTSFRFSKAYNCIAALCLGLLFDSYYIGVIGIYSLCLPIFMLIHYHIFEEIEPTILTLLLGFIVSITFVEVSTFIVQVIFQLADGEIVALVTKVLGPTLLFNSALFIVFIYPMKRILHLNGKE